MAHIFRCAYTRTHAVREIARCCALFFKQSPWLCIKCACLYVCLFVCAFIFSSKMIEARAQTRKTTIISLLVVFFLFLGLFLVFFPLSKPPYKTSSIPLNPMSFVQIYMCVCFNLLRSIVCNFTQT